MTDEKPMAKLQIGVEAYKAKNAQNGWTGRGYGLEPFFLNLNKDGDASVGFAEKDANYETDDETGRTYIYCNSPVSEVIALRDFLNEAFPSDLQSQIDDLNETIKELRAYARV